MYAIQCTVSGGVTGYRSALLKSKGEIQYFDSLKEAENEARRLSSERNNAFSTARFSYCAVEA